MATGSIIGGGIDGGAKVAGESGPAAAPAIVTPASAADLDALVRLEEASFVGDRLSRRSYRRLLRASSAAILAARAGGGAITGSLVLLFRKGSASARIYSVAVDPSARKAGIGRQLMAAAEGVAAARGARTIRLEVRADNAAAIRLYEALGYAVTGRVEGYYADGEAAVLMARTLPTAEDAA